MKSRRRGLETSPLTQQKDAILQEEQHHQIQQQEQEQQESTLSLGIPMITQQQQQEMMVMEQDRYIDNRSTAIESIESTIAELGGIFQQLATMVAEQRETVQRYYKRLNVEKQSIDNNCSFLFLELIKIRTISR